MNEKAPEEAERGNALRMSSPSKKVARRPGAEMMWPSEDMGQGSRCALAWYDGTERRGGTRLGACDTTLENSQNFEFSGVIAAYVLGANQVVGEPLVRDVRRSGARQKACHRPTRVLVHKRSGKRVADPEVRHFQLIGQRVSRGLAHFERSKHWRYAH
jgi:hypothetical protein